MQLSNWDDDVAKARKEIEKERAAQTVEFETVENPIANLPAKRPRTRAQQWWHNNALFLVIAVIIALVWNVVSRSNRTSSGTFDEIDARVNIRRAIELQLRSPSTVDFPIMDGGTFQGHTLKSYFDAQNGFGATVRTYYRATVDDSGKVVSLEIDN